MLAVRGQPLLTTAQLAPWEAMDHAAFSEGAAKSSIFLNEQTFEVSVANTPTLLSPLLDILSEQDFGSVRSRRIAAWRSGTAVDAAQMLSMIADIGKAGSARAFRRKPLVLSRLHISKAQSRRSLDWLLMSRDRALRQALAELQANPEQSAAVVETGHCIVLAGPGSGKTKTLTTAMARVLAQDVVEPRGVACITYNNECAIELETRLARLGITPGERAFIGTVHGFAAEPGNRSLCPLRAHGPSFELQGRDAIGSEGGRGGGVQELHQRRRRSPPAMGVRVREAQARC